MARLFEPKISISQTAVMIFGFLLFMGYANLAHSQVREKREVEIQQLQVRELFVFHQQAYDIAEGLFCRYEAELVGTWKTRFRKELAGFVQHVVAAKAQSLIYRLYHRLVAKCQNAIDPSELPDPSQFQPEEPRGELIYSPRGSPCGRYHDLLSAPLSRVIKRQKRSDETKLVTVIGKRKRCGPVRFEAGPARCFKKKKQSS